MIDHKTRQLLPDILLLLALTAGLSFLQIREVHVPAEDAAMLLRYSEHFSQGHGIVWNIGEPPVDGATDFLYMILVGMLAMVGLSVELAARSLSFVAHLVTVLVLYYYLVRNGTSRVFAFFGATLVAIGPGRYYVTALFGTTVFALFGFLAWLALWQTITIGDDRYRWHFAFAGLACALTRPEGNFLVGFMLLALIAVDGVRKSARFVLTTIVIFLVVGGAYFLWRVEYFGYLLPNPFYVKGGFEIENLLASLSRTFFLTFPILIVSPYLIIGPVTRRMAIAFLIPLLGFTLMFAFVSNQMNFVSRFQYILFPISIISFIELFNVMRNDLPKFLHKFQSKPLSNLVIPVLLGAYFVLFDFFFSYKFTKDSTADVGRFLAQFESKGYNLITTEAGLISLYSHWSVIDAYGLNDSWIAHHDGITLDYARKSDPEVILMHGSYRPMDDWSFIGSDPWPRMLRTLQQFAEENDYILVAAYGDQPSSVHYYYVKPDFEDSESIVKYIRSMTYYKLGSDTPSRNFSDSPGF